MSDDPAAQPLELFRGAMGRFPAAVCVITTRNGTELAAMTATAVTSYSATPPSMLCCIDHAAQSHALLERCERFAINVLHAEQAETALAFARSDLAKLERGELVIDEADGVPVIAGALATLVCERDATFSHFDHSVLLGRVVGGHLDAALQPLLYAERRFWTLAEH